MKTAFLLSLLFLALSCSEDPTSSNSKSGGISDASLAHTYVGEIRIEYSGDYNAVVETDTLIGSAITRRTGVHHVILFDPGLGLTFNGNTLSGSNTMQFVDSSTIEAGLMKGMINKDSISIISKSGTFTLNTLNETVYEGSYTGVFKGSVNGKPVYTTAEAIFELRYIYENMENQRPIPEDAGIIWKHSHQGGDK